MLHRNKTFNTGKYTRLFTASGTSKLVKYIYISKKKTSNILLCLFPRTKFCNSDYSSCSFVCRLICVNRARSCTPSCKPRLGKARAIKKREGERERERDESRNWSICFMPGFRIGWKCQKWTVDPRLAWNLSRSKRRMDGSPSAENLDKTGNWPVLIIAILKGTISAKLFLQRGREIELTLSSFGI